MALFSHTDDDDDSMELLADGGSAIGDGDLVMRFQSLGAYRSGGVRLNRFAQMRLANALDLHLHQDPNVEPDPVYTALVRRLVAEEVAKVLPLHQAPQAAVHDLRQYTTCHRSGRHDRDTLCSDCTVLPEPDPVLRQYATNTGLPICADPNCGLAEGHAEHDPEPHDVGHAEEPLKAQDWSDRLWNSEETTCNGHRDPTKPLAEVHPACGHLWAVHAARPTKAKPRLMAEVKPVKSVSAELPGTCGECAHSFGMHPPKFGVTYCAQYTDGVVCGCRASAP